MTKLIRASNEEGIHLGQHVSRFLHIIVDMGCPVFIYIFFLYFNEFLFCYVLHFFTF